MQKEAWTPCHKCHMRFPRKDVLKDHAKRVHQGGKSKCLICEEVFWTDNLFRQHWKKCVLKWVKSAKNVQENAAVEEHFMSQVMQEQSTKQTLKPPEIIPENPSVTNNEELKIERWGILEKCPLVKKFNRFSS